MRLINYGETIGEQATAGNTAIRTAQTVLQFGQTFIAEARSGMAGNNAVHDSIQSTLTARANRVSPTSSAGDVAKAMDMFETKLLRPRPRLVGAIAAYGLMANKSYAEVQEQGGLPLFRGFWAIGSVQDDYIDEIEPQTLADTTQAEKVIVLNQAIFGPQMEFFRAAYTTLIDHLHDTKSNFGVKEQTYLKQQMASWFSFLLKQEAEVFARANSNQPLDFEYCRAYREDQNGKIGEVLTALLNGRSALDPKLRILETMVPVMSFRTQIIDDIADTVEDLEMNRPSYAIGALHTFPDEQAAMQSYINQHQIKKVTPETFKRVAPQAYALLRDTYAEYGAEIRGFGTPAAVFLANVGELAFHAFPKMRDVMYKINPKYANF